MSVKGGNLGSEGLELATPDRQPDSSYRDTHTGRAPARGRSGTLHLRGAAVINKLDDPAGQARATNEERVTFDNLLPPPAPAALLTALY